MFERRLKVLLGCIGFIAVLLIGRVFAVQVVNRGYWQRQSNVALTRPQSTETMRGRILDRNGNEMARDVACTDGCVDYRVITDVPDPKFVADTALARVKKKYGPDYKKTTTADQRKTLLAAETDAVKKDIEQMWMTLGNLYRPGPDENTQTVDDVRKQIVRNIENRRHAVWSRGNQSALAESQNSSKWTRWLTGGPPALPDFEHCSIVLVDQEKPQVILPDLDPETYNFLGKRLEQFPGLVLQPSAHRVYPMRSTFCHAIGRLSRVNEKDLEQARAAGIDEPHGYRPSDPIGREGIEALCEPLLRGGRGKIERQVSDNAILNEQEFTRGQDVKLTIDGPLQAKAQDILAHVVEIADPKDGGPKRECTPPGGVSMHGAAVVIDVKTGGLLVLASNPGFDANDLETGYARLLADTVEAPLRDRATSDAVEPGSTVKPMLGLAAVTDKFVGPTEGIECTGYLKLPAIGPDGKKTSRLVQQAKGRCWVVSEFAAFDKSIPPAHHQIGNAPHVGIFGNPDGWLTFSDAITRSCDIYFETLADRMGPAGVGSAYDRFGLGRPTGVGIYERPGLRPGQRRAAPTQLENALTGIGQGTVLASPLQIANAAATIARDGIWVRPRLLSDKAQQDLDKVKPRNTDGDRVDLHLDPEAVNQARIGMRNVVDGPGGTGSLKEAWPDRPSWLFNQIAAKTGTADAPPQWVVDRNDVGVETRHPRVPTFRWKPETDTPWYRSEGIIDGKTSLVYAWFMGYAPADDPQIAFAVLVEYAGIGGGGAAAPVGARILQACADAGYLRPPGTPPTTQPDAN